MAFIITNIGLFVGLCILVVHTLGRPQDMTAPSTEKTTWDKIKDGVEHGFNVAYDGVHCGFHKVKELVKHHDHDDGNDPCQSKQYQKNAPKSIDLRVDDVVLVTTYGPL